MRHTFLLPFLIAGAAVAQDCPRPITQINGNAQGSGFRPVVVSPKSIQAGDPLRGTVATSQLVYGVFIDTDANTGLNTLQVQRSLDGGFSWDPANRVEAWTSQTGETIDTNFRVVADGDLLYIGFTTDRDPDGQPNAGNDDSAWVLASNDQGQTFQSVCVSTAILTPLAGGEDFNDIDDVEIALSNAGCQVMYEADYDVTMTGGSTSGSESLYHQIVTFDASGNLVTVFPVEQQLTTFAPGDFDVDDNSIVADGNNVIAFWHEPVANGGGDNDDVVSRTSTNGGLTFGPIVNHTNFAGDQSEDEILGAMDGNLVVLAQLDSRDPNTTEDYFSVSISNDGGVTWTFDVPVGSRVSDIDEPVSMTVNGNNIIIAYEDERDAGTTLDRGVILVDNNAGQDFINGVVNEFNIFPGVLDGNDTIYNCSANGDVIAVAAEFDTAAGGEGAGIAYSNDGGRSWNSCVVFPSQATTDVDDPWVSVSANGDINVIWADDSQGGNDTYVTGLKQGLLTDESSTFTGIRYDGSPSEAGNNVFLLASLTAPTSGGIPTSVLGLDLNFTADAVTFDLLAAPSVFSQLADANGDADFLVGLPNLATFIGFDVWYIAIPFDANGNPTRGASDALLQRQ